MTGLSVDIAELMSSAVDFSARHVDEGGLPFAGLLVDADGYASSFGVNEVHQTGDATAHAEIIATREALRDRSGDDLTGTWLLATGEPCGLCYHFALAQRVERIYVAVDADEVAGWGFDYRPSYRSFAIDRGQLQRDGVLQWLPVPTGPEPFHRFINRYPQARPASQPLRPNPKGTS